ncbi:MAG: hypothetical protein HY647_10605 [Acidobacteria bacterium]|nr:hypothetical protein [Acidobacteriota bacterium]
MQGLVDECLERELPFEEMSLSKADKEWVEEQIKDAIGGTRWQKFKHWAREWSAPSVAVVILLAAIGTWNKFTAFQARTDERLKTIEAALKEIKDQLPSGQLVRAVSGESTKEALEQVQGIVERAKAEAIVLEPEAVKTAGDKVMEAAFTQPEVSQLAWTVATQIFNYRSVVNAMERPGGPPPGTQRLPTAIRISGKARLTVRDSFFEGLEQTLDGGVWENVIFRNCVIKYNGGPVTLRNVRFENSTFEIILAQPSKELGNALLVSTTTNVDIGG